MAVATRQHLSVSEMSQKMALEKTDATMQEKIHRVHRAALGDIGNKVSKMTIDTSKIVKKELLHPIKKDVLHTEALHPPTTRQQARMKLLDRPPVKVEPAVVVELLAAGDHINDLMDISMDKTEAYSKAISNIEDIDSDDKDNPQLVTDYVNDIYRYMRTLEGRYMVRPDYLNGCEINGKMRSILIDWLCQVHHRFSLLQETLYLTVSILDRYLQVNPVTRSKLQLVGVTCMLVASKYEEMYAPEVADFVYITDNAYTKADIHEMERHIIRTLDFSFGKPLCIHFLRRNSKAGQVDATKHTLAKYLMELTIIEYDMVHQLPSKIAAAALCLSIRLLDHSRWTETLSHYSAYTEKEVVSLMKKLAQLVLKAETSKIKAVKTKYSGSKFMKIADIPELKSPLIHQIANAS